MPVCRNCDVNFPNRMIIDGCEKNLGNRKFCIDCTPYKSHNTKASLSDSTDRSCPCCKKIKPIIEFYNRRGKKGQSVYCKVCTNWQTTKRQRNFKEKCVEYKGGKCSLCGYSKCIEALEFHHKNPEKKDFSISKTKLKTFDENVKKELDKCVLCCANCHREIHSQTIICPRSSVE